MLRRRKSPAKLYWRLERPGLRKYARPVAHVIIYRAVAVAAASLAITLYAFLGVVIGNVSYPRWPAVRSIDDQTISLAEAHSTAELSHGVPAFIVLGLILVSIPRAHLWVFRITMLSGVALGYYYRRLPPFPQSALAIDIIRRTASLTRSIPRHLAVSPIAAVGLLLAAAVVARVLYRTAYILTARSTSFIPRRPRSHNYSAFIRTELTRRLVAVPVTAVLLSVSLWIVQNIRAPLPGARYGVQSSATDWMLATVVVALIICMPSPRGYRWPLITLWTAITVYALSPHVRLLRIPSWLPAASNSFWILVIVYFVVIGFGFDLVTALLDWPIRIPFLGR
jgi:hypothetical protein